MTPTMKEVASRAGVSVKSVSRVVNDHPNISDAVRERVRHAIDELDWQPNVHARSLRTGRTGLIALSLIDLTAPTSSRLAQAVVIEAERQGLQVSIEPSRGLASRISQTLDSRGAFFDAVLHLGALPRGVTMPAHDPDLPVLMICPSIDLSDGEPPALDTIDIDEVAAAAAIARHLRMVGHGDVAILAGADGVPNTFVDRLVLDLPHALLLRPSPAADPQSHHRGQRSIGRELMTRALELAPTTGTVICADDELAIGALSLLRERGIDVPGQVALTGHGNIDDGWYTSPSLTTIDTGVQETARRAIDMVTARLGGDRSSPRRQVVPVALVRAESTLGTSGRSSPSLAHSALEPPWPG